MLANTYTIFSIAFLILLQIGCAPIPYTYYAPSTDGGRLFNSVAAAIAPANRVEFCFDGVRIQIEGLFNGLYLVVQIPKNKTAQFINDNLQLFDSYSDAITTIPFTIHHYYQNIKKSITQNPTNTMYHTIKPNSFCMRKSSIYENQVLFDSNKKQREQYSVKLPDIKVNNITYEIPLVTFTLKTSFGIFPLNS